MTDSDLVASARTWGRLRYPISLPERLVRATASSVGGLLHEGSLVVLPEVVRRSQLYQVLIGRWLRITVELVGGVQGFTPADAMPADRLMVRKVTGNIVELGGILVVGWSPVWLLAAASDLSSASRAYLDALTDELKRQGLLPPEAEASSVADLLDSLGRTTGDLSKIVDIPPLERAEIRATLDETRASLEALWASTAGLPNREQLDALAVQLRGTAEREGVSMWTLSMLAGLGALQAGAKVCQVHVIDYYRTAMAQIIEGDLAGYVRRVSKPYVARTVEHLDPGHPSHTERFLGRIRRPVRAGDGGSDAPRTMVAGRLHGTS